MDRQIPTKPSIRQSRRNTTSDPYIDYPRLPFHPDNFRPLFFFIKIGLIIIGAIIAIVAIIVPIVSFIWNSMPTPLIALVLLGGTIFFLIKVFG